MHVQRLAAFLKAGPEAAYPANLHKTAQEIVDKCEAGAARSGMGILCAGASHRMNSIKQFWDEVKTAL